VRRCLLLTGPGCAFESNLASFFLDSLQSVARNLSSNGAVTRYNLPSTVRQDDKESVARDISTWKALLQAQHGSTLWDRQLPQIHLLQCTTTDDAPRVLENHQQETTTHITHQRSNKKQQRTPWFHKLQPAKQIQILALTGPSLAADSRPLQRQLMEQVLDLYQQLASSTATTTHGDVKQSLVRIRAVPAQELLPMESSRLVVEGWTATTANATNNKRTKRQESSSPVCLASLSNLQDYCTNDTKHCKIRHGTKENLHVLQGTLCRVGEVMEWLCQTHATAAGVELPRPLRVGKQQQLEQQLSFNKSSQQPQLLPYTKKVITSAKGGKRIVVEVPFSPTTTAPSPSSSSLSEQQKKTTSDANNNNPTTMRIHTEALSSPFNFLPFYHR